MGTHIEFKKGFVGHFGMGRLFSVDDHIKQNRHKI